MSDESVTGYQQRFGGIRRLYGEEAFRHLESMHVCVIGLGGVGSWAVEALARSGVGQLTLIDFDEICLTNTNRQLHALSDTVGQKKQQVMAQRVKAINPDCRCHTIDDFVTTQTLAEYLSVSHGYDYVIDAIDSIKFKSEIIYFCKRNKIPIVTTGGAGGINDPSMIKVADLSRTYNDPLAAKVRSRLRTEFGYTRNRKRSFGVECVFSSQQKLYPKADGSVSHEKPGVHGISLDCRFGYGSASFVTAAFGFIAASRVINKTLQKRSGNKI
ncbi:MAG TPA: tRNA cyclic N6-threonylcarbamoyladenosine(37) synthase TcdA [Gammaproteobacteria bacterium]|nr:tRNA cyclic N6-threonylcarbamoyladenosine(37) synthase TcdA [Gammaproteobacteria bacterium]